MISFSKLKNNWLKFLFKNYRKQEVKLHELKYLFWECTLRCNLNCLHCGSDCSKESGVGDIPFQDFIQSIESIPKTVKRESITIVITGGEPLLRADLEACGREIRKRGFRWGIVTNGYFYNELRHHSLLNAGLGALTLSIDGFEGNHNWLRNSKNSFKKAEHALDLIRMSHRLNYDVVTCVNQRNIHELSDLKKYFIDKNIKAWRLFTISPIGRAANNKELQLNPDQFKYLMDFIEAARKEKKIDLKFSCEGYVGEYENKVRDGFFFCRAGVNIGSVLIDGSIAACPNIDRNFAQGNIYRDNFWEVWNNRFELMRNRNELKVGQCKTCKEFLFCQGNGMHYWTKEKTGVMFCHKEKLDAAKKHNRL